jgi:dienelactone hydrolase
LLAAIPPLLATASANAMTRPADLLQDWHDPERGRTIPVRIRLPAASAPAPVVIISHGLGGSRDGLAYLGIGLADAGFIAVHAQHHGTDTAVWRGAESIPLAMAAAVLDVRNALDRLKDVAFALDTLPGALHGRVDMTHAAIAGHSYGAWTVTHMLGERLPMGNWGLALPDQRLKAGIAISPIPPLGLPPSIATPRSRRRSCTSPAARTAASSRPRPPRTGPRRTGPSPPPARSPFSPAPRTRVSPAKRPPVRCGTIPPTRAAPPRSLHCSCAPFCCECKGELIHALQAANGLAAR